MTSSNARLIEKYNIPGPRYTSYPTVPFWDSSTFSRNDWIKQVKDVFSKTNYSEGISLYVHLPYCESLCTYCGCNTRITVNHAVELPYINMVIQELEMYKRLFGRSPHIKEIHLGGGTPTFFKPENLFILLDGILSGSIISDEAAFSFEGHPLNTTYEHLKVLHGLGFRRVSYGIQDFDKKVQNAINRIQPKEDVENVMRWSRELGYQSVNFDLVYGLPFQTINTVKETIENVIELRPDRIAFYSYAHVPWVKPGQRSFSEKDLPNGEEKRALYELGRSMFEKSGYVEIGMDHFSLRDDSLCKALKSKTIHRNFMVFTTAKTLMMIGLGVSSISDTTTAFAQNEKTVERYKEEVSNGNFPVFRGHILTAEDSVLRKHILNLICQYETDWKDKKNQCEALFEALEELDEFKKDDLISISDSQLTINEKGYPFVRNICMAFDRRMKEKDNKYKLFSQTI